MGAIQDNVRAGLHEAARLLQPVDPVVALDLRRLADEVDKPCTVAVVGQVKAGKSSFVNALLDEDVAMVGTTETTATINHMIYGVPDNKDLPILCVWRDGSVEPCGKAFLDGLQGRDIETLRRADGIGRLEYRRPLPFLRQATLVDTPGTGAVVDEHQNRSAEYLRLENQLRQRHDAESRMIEGRADAIIYITGNVPRRGDQQFLEAFGQGTGEVSRALKAVGVITKIDARPDVLARPDEFAAEYAEALKGHLGAVVPVSAALHRTANRLAANDWAVMARLIDGIRRIPAATLDKILSNEEWLMEDDFAARLDFSPSSRAEVLALRALVDPWPVFTLIAGMARANPAPTPAALGARIAALSGFDRLREVLERQFFARGHIVRCFRIMDDAMAAMRALRYERLEKLRDAAAEARARQQRFSSVLAAIPTHSPFRQELADFLDAALAETMAAPQQAEPVIEQVLRRLEGLHGELVRHNQDFDALQKMMTAPELFTPEEREELEPLFGRRGVERSARLPGRDQDSTYCVLRQSWWSQRLTRERHPLRQQVAKAAMQRYGALIKEQNNGR
ncbi:MULTISPECIES: dynamin family protein [unclassified Azospirillum]|uniref:dynamin family protein n=1 Tax=unclassified Azospirillum TaxID=2630922 RepID=UPI000B67CDA1|nr:MULTISPECIES: dynamin family protein [unclassified Azospirillum]SNT09298.1 Dynamin family protein [Azospirillum sp. RU38E]SNT24911.1 Dynamin family protein [Azospirillum sp. RU37A]